MTVTEKVAYLKGLAKGLDLAEDKAETKMFNAVIDVLEDMALSIYDLEDSVDEIQEYAEELDEDLGELEELVYDEFDDCDCDCCDDDCDCDDDELYEIVCPACHETIYIDESAIEDGEINCPSCDERLEFDFDCDCDCCEDDCDCDE